MPLREVLAAVLLAVFSVAVVAAGFMVSVVAGLFTLGGASLALALILANG